MIRSLHLLLGPLAGVRPLSVRFIKLLLEYNGAGYQGWQTQKTGRTIQDIICATIASITGEDVRLTGASRTDAGVHALGQVAAFSTASALPPEIIQRALNAKLPSDIRILAAEETSGEFHPRYDAIRKSYFYLISTSRVRSAFFSPYLWYIPADLDLVSMREAAAALLGEHDFSAFRGAGCGAKTTIRTVNSLDITGAGEISFMTASIPGDFIKIRIEANAFLRHMVRNIVGTLADVGSGKTSVEEFSRILASCDRTLAGPTAPPQGLFLEQLIY
ncbi:MAG: tRNA pseudouridine(38-40) synthase TruA [Thermodesulfovibrio sp.]|nr:tRNA pseudouridine(38-40) synthase TruA [Thermodesulfovibrio sp.]